MTDLRAVPDVEPDEEAGGPVATKKKDTALADAAEEALGETGPEADMDGEQGELFPACRVKFQGMAWDSLEVVPDLKQKMVFRVEGTVVGHEQQVRADGEIRDFAKVKCEKIVLIEE